MEKPIGPCKRCDAGGQTGAGRRLSSGIIGRV
jgi:hypothetical protein